MGDIICRNCGEPWDAYGARHGDMSQAECQMLMSGKGCPSCEGKPVYVCTKFQGIIVYYSMLKKPCEHVKWGKSCGLCEFKRPRKRVDDMVFLTSLESNTDGNEALDAAMQMFDEKRKRATVGPL